MTAGVIAVVVMVLGLVWVAIEHRRIRGIFERWASEHPDVPRSRLSS
jgi:hypothetical protein